MMCPIGFIPQTFSQDLAKRPVMEAVPVLSARLENSLIFVGVEDVNKYLWYVLLLPIETGFFIRYSSEITSASNLITFPGGLATLGGNTPRIYGIRLEK